MTEPTDEVAAVAYAIARVIAEKTIESDPGLRRMDALGRASAATTMAMSMAPELHDEAKAAIDAVRQLVEGAA